MTHRESRQNREPTPLTIVQMAITLKYVLYCGQKEIKFGSWRDGPAGKGAKPEFHL